MRFAADLHVDTLEKLAGAAGASAAQVTPSGCRAGGVRLLVTACFTRDGDVQGPERVRGMLEALEHESARPDGWLTRVSKLADLERLPPERVAALPSVENAASLAGSIGRLTEWFEAGVRIVGLTWNGSNQLAAGVLAPSDDGLTGFGRAVVREMRLLDLAVDLSHLGPAGVDEVLASGVRVLATHSNARALCDHPRNLTDEQLRAIREQDGIVGVNFYPPFLVAGGGAAEVDSIARHAAHMAEILGPGRVALGSDLDGIELLPVGIAGHAELPRVARALASVGFGEREIDGVYGENFLRWWGRGNGPAR